MGLGDDDQDQHTVIKVDDDEDISWGTPISTGKKSTLPTENRQKTQSNSGENIKKSATATTNRQKQKDKAKYFYLNKSARPFSELTGKPQKLYI